MQDAIDGKSFSGVRLTDVEMEDFSFTENKHRYPRDGGIQLYGD